MNEEMIDQSVLAEDLSEKIKYSFLDYFLVKPLDPIKVKKEFSKPVPTGKATKDADGIEAQDFDKVETEVKEVDSDYRKVVVIKTPLSYEAQFKDEQTASVLTRIKAGDIVIIKDTTGLRFDLLKDSRLVRYYDILGIEK